MAGFSQISGDFSMDRFFGLLPFYVIGLVKPEHFDLLNRRSGSGSWAGSVLVGAAGVAIFIAPRAPLGPFYYQEQLRTWTCPGAWAWACGPGCYLLAGDEHDFAVLALVPRRETVVSDLGTRTLYCYLLHGVTGAHRQGPGLAEFPWLHGPLGVMAIASSALALAIVLCLPETRTLFKWVLEPRLVWLYRRPSAPAEAVPKPPDEAAARESSASVTR